MDSLQETLSAALEDTFEPLKLVSIAVMPQLREWGIQLSDSESAKLESEFQEITLEAATLNLMNYSVSDSTGPGEYTAENRMSIAKKTMTLVVGLVMADKTRKLVEGLQEHTTSIIRDEREEQRQLEQRVSEEWQEPLDLLNALIALAKGVRSNFDDQFLEDAVRSDGIVFVTLAIVHAKACQVSSEILVLLRSGLADGAYARWRTLYELSAVGLFIKKYGREVAVRYSIHGLLERCKLARRYQQDRAPGDSSGLPQELIDNFASLEASIVETYGKQFKGDYGWAASVLRGRPKLFDIANSVGLGSSYSDYKLASSSVHASAFSTLRLSVPGAPLGSAVHAKPNPIDLKSPGYNCGRSLEEITTVLLKSQPGLDDGAVLKRGAIIRSLHKLASNVLKAFDEAESNVESQSESKN